ncbi:MAG: c-type cytochrome [Chloroflexota bacterium]
MARWIGVAIAGIALLVAAGLGVLYGLTGWRFSRTYSISISPPAIPADAATIARGEHLVVAIAKCIDCHGVDLGGNLLVDDPMLGRLAGPNLTRGRGGVGGQLKDEDWVRALRHGVARDGRALKFMPAQETSKLTDEDLAAVIAYAKSVPPVDREMLPTAYGPLGRFLVLRGEIEISAEIVDHGAKAVPSRKVEPTVEYGDYLAHVGGCVVCHGPSLSGGHVPGSPPWLPPAANITPTGIGSWTEEQFFTALRTGARPDGSRIDPFMPWAATSKMTDEETRALYLYLKTVPPRPTGNR